MKRFEDKVVLITGAASGIGRETALRMADEGATLACADIQTEAVEATAKEAAKRGAETLVLSCDVSSQASCDEVVARTIERFGRIDSLCNIAGILHFDNTHELSLERWQKIIDVNLTGTFLMCKAALPHLLESHGNIVNMSSTAALKGQPWSAAYSASKGGVLSFTNTLAVEFGKQGVRANAVSPGGVITPIHEAFEFPEGCDKSLLQRIMPLDKMRGPEVAAAVIVFLASDEAAHINGENIRVDGGSLS